MLRDVKHSAHLSTDRAQAEVASWRGTDTHCDVYPLRTRYLLVQQRVLTCYAICRRLHIVNELQKDRPAEATVTVWAKVLDAFKSTGIPDEIEGMDGRVRVVSAAVALHDETPLLIKARARKPPVGRVLVLVPRSSTETAAAVDALRRLHLEFVVTGACSNVVGSFLGSPPIVLSTEEMAGVLTLDKVSQTVTVGAGTMGGDLESWLNERGFTLALFPQSLHMSTVGGWVATRATGSLSARLGGVEAAIVGGTVVTASGDTLHFPDRVRPAGGLDGLSLFVGSEGSLGVVTSVSLKVYRRTEERTMCFSFRSFEGLIEAQRELIQGTYPINLLRGYNHEESRHILGDIAPESHLLIVSTTGPNSLIQDNADAIARCLEGWGADRLDDHAADKWFRERFAVETMMEDRNKRPDRYFDTIEASVPWGTSVACISEIERTIRPQVATLHIHTSHIYPNGVGFYVLVWLNAGEGQDGMDALRSVWTNVVEITTRHSGMCGHHHGIGEMRRAVYSTLPDAHVHRLVKGAMDPEGLLYARLLEA